MKLITKQWVDLFKAAGITRADLEPTNENHTEKVIMAHISGPCVMPPGGEQFVIFMPPGAEPPMGEDWLAIEREFGINRTLVEKEPFKAQFREVIEKQCGPDRLSSPKELHNDWWDAYVRLGWEYGPVRSHEAKTHPDMVEFEQLEQREQDKDIVFYNLCEIARQWIW